MSQYQSTAKNNYTEQKIKELYNTREFDSLFRSLTSSLEEGDDANEFFAPRARNTEDVSKAVTSDFFAIDKAWQYNNRVLCEITVGSEEGGSGHVWVSLVKIEDDWRIYDLNYKKKSPSQLIVDEILEEGLPRNLRAMMSGFTGC
jgi:hypothetical protein